MFATWYFISRNVRLAYANLTLRAEQLLGNLAPKQAFPTFHLVNS
jgi:hypothetical protein